MKYFRDPQDHHQAMEDIMEAILLHLILVIILQEIEDLHQDLLDQATHLRLVVHINLSFYFCVLCLKSFCAWIAFRIEYLNIY